MEFLTFVRSQWDRVGAAAAVAIGFLCLVLGWRGTSETEFVAKQIPHLISGGLGGVFFLGVGAVLWISADLRDEWRELRKLGARLEEDAANARQHEADEIAHSLVAKAPVARQRRSSAGLPR